jgi:hypothetical protein
MATVKDLATWIAGCITKVQGFINEYGPGYGLSPLPALPQRGWTEEYVQALGNYNDPYVPGRVT